MMLRWLLMSWVWTVTMGLIGLIVLTHPLKPVVASPPPPITVTQSKPMCFRGVVADINNCGTSTIYSCKKISSAPGAPGTGNQCLICSFVSPRISFVIQGVTEVEKRWYDCNGDNHADCEIWWQDYKYKKCIITITLSTSATSLSSVEPFASETECICPEESVSDPVQ